jgi:hypothetical protein
MMRQRLSPWRALGCALCAASGTFVLAVLAAGVVWVLR